MTTFPGSPKLLRGGLVLFDLNSDIVQRIIVMQYNPATLNRTLQVQGATGEGGDRLEALRLTGPPVETYQLEAEIDAADQLEFPNVSSHRSTVEYGILPQLAAMETIIYPSSNRIRVNNQLASSGSLEIIPMETPLTLFVWSKNRVLPVRITDFSVTEEAYDPNLNPLRAKVSMSLRVLSGNDLNYDHFGSSLFRTYHQQQEQLARKAPSATLDTLGIGGLL